MVPWIVLSIIPIVLILLVFTLIVFTTLPLFVVALFEMAGVVRIVIIILTIPHVAGHLFVILRLLLELIVLVGELCCSFS